MRLAMMHHLGHHAERGRDHALAALDRACETNFAPGCIAARVFRANQPLPASVLEPLRQRCDGGDHEACQIVFALLDTGWIADPSRHTSMIQIQKRLCRAGDPVACLWIFEACHHELYRALNGVRCALFHQRAVALFTERCAEGAPEACRAREALSSDQVPRGPTLDDCFADGPLGFDLKMCSQFIPPQAD